jgi:hypothetical protein
MTGFPSGNPDRVPERRTMNAKQEINLMNFVESSLGRPFAWGECDCNTFALEAMDAAYGLSLAAKIMGHYRTMRGAIRYRRRSPWGDLISLLKEAGFVSGKKGFEQVGDILIASDRLRRWEMAQVYLGRHCVSAFPDDAVRLFPCELMQSAAYEVWRYPCLLQ